MEHYHYIVSGFAHEEPGGKLIDWASIDVLANSEEDALVKAGKLVEKKYHRVVSVITHDDDICNHRGGS